MTTLIEIVGAHCMRPKNVANSGIGGYCNERRAHISAPLQVCVYDPAEAGRAGV